MLPPALTQQALAKVRQKLLDLTRRNRLLNYKESVRSIRVIDELPDEVFRLLVIEGKGMEFLPTPEQQEPKEEAQRPLPYVPQSANSVQQKAISRNNELPDPSQKHKRHQDTRLQTPFTPQLLERRCKKLLQESRTAIEETGSNLLYLAIGFLEWSESDDSTEVNRAPLILLPVQIERMRIDKDTNCYTYAISYNEEDTETNICLAEKLDHDFDLILPELGEEATPESYLEEVRKMIRNKSRWRVAREMVIGLFSFSKILMYKDLDNDKWPDDAKITAHKNITQILVGKDPEDQTEERIYGEEYNIDAESAYHKIPLILDTDSSQHSAIIDALLKQENLVIEGPPGTGKSQTITNLIAAALNEGKSVLFVAEKKAALEVVRSRLNHAGLGDFCLELHSHKTQKGQLHFDLAKRISRQFGDAYNLSSDHQALTQVRDKLLAYSNLVNKAVGYDGKTIYDIFWAAERWRTEVLNSTSTGFAVENAMTLRQQEIDDRVGVLKDLARLRTELPDTAIKAWQCFKPTFIFADDEQKVSMLLKSFLADIERYQAFLGSEGSGIPIDLNIGFLRQLMLANIDVLEQKPSDLDEQMSLKFMDSRNIEVTTQLNGSIEEFRELMKEAETVTKGIEPLSIETVKSLTDAASAVDRIGYGENTPAELAEFASALETASKAIRDIENLSEVAATVLPEAPTKISDLLHVVNIGDVIKKAPEDIAINHHQNHIRDNAYPTYQAVHQKCLELDAKNTAIQEFYQIVDTAYRALIGLPVRAITDPLPVAVVKSLADATSSLERMGYGDNHLAELSEISLVIEVVSRDLQHTENVMKTVSEFLPQIPAQIGDAIINLATVSNVIKKAPEDIAINFYPNHIKDHAYPRYQAIRQKCTELAAKITEQAKFFNVRCLPRHTDILKYAQQLRKYKGNYLALLFSEYRMAKTGVKGFLLEPKSFNASDLVSRLERLADVIAEMDEVNRNHDFKQALGPLYVGVKTDWNRMERHVTWCQEFSEAIGSQSFAESIMQNYVDTKKILQASETLKSMWAKISDALDKVKMPSSADLTTKQLLEKISVRQQIVHDAMSSLSAFRTALNKYTVSDIVYRLVQLASVLEKMDEVNHNHEYKQALGPQYVGIKTDWTWMENHISWCQEFRQVLRSQSLAESLLRNYKDTKDKILIATETLQTSWNLVCDALNKAKVPVRADVRPMQLLDTINSRQQTIRDALSVLSKHQSLLNIDIATINACGEAYLSAANLNMTIEKDRRFVKLLGQGCYRGVETNTQRLLRTANWVTDLQEQGRCPKQIVKWLLESDIDLKTSVLKKLIPATRSLVENFDSTRKEFNAFNDKETTAFLWGNELSLNLTELQDSINACINSIQYLVTWADYCRSCKTADAMGLNAVIKTMDAKQIRPDESVPLYLFSVYESMARELIRQYPELASFTRASYENIKNRFSELDTQIMKASRDHIGCNTSKRPIPGGLGWGPVKDWTEFRLLAHELQKKKRHIPIRQLVRRAGNALKALKPCFMMSPMSVAQYLKPGETEFDMVIMDEASQLRPEDALGAISRAKQLVVVGDPNQLPPSTFFERMDGDSEDDEDETAIQNTESILDICLSIYKKRRLRWHYRSEHESLIAFSNYQFYDDDLIIFPSPQSNKGYNGVRHHYIEGATYLKGRNRVEAEAVALAVVSHFRNHPEMSLGVATFNREQCDLIQDALERLQKEQPWLERKIKDTDIAAEPFFIKNLENVQGDERDVIFVSTTYGPDPTTGHVFQRFGPISRDAGWRRLNVIFTRAKKRLELFTSMRSSDIKLPERPSRGVQSLRAYLEYAETGILPSLSHPSGRPPDSDFEVAVSRILESYGYKVVPQIGVAGFFIDMGVKHPERDWEYILGIECDGAAYHSAKSVRDRDRLRQEILEKKGWKIHRIWSTDWFKNREKEIQRLMGTLREIVEKDRSRVVVGKDERTEPAKEVTKPVAVQAPIQKTVMTAGNGKTLKEELMQFNEANILSSFPDKSKGILRDELLAYFIKLKPTSMKEFYTIPMELRQKTDSKQMQFLDDIFEIIQEYGD